MNFLDDLKTWHWAIIGIIAGLIVGVGLSFNPPRDDALWRRPMSLEQFTAAVQQSIDGDLAIRNITVGPTENGQQLVTGEIGPDNFRPFALYINVPFDASNVHADSVQQYLQAAAQINRNIHFHLAYWRSAWFSLAAGALGGLIIIGGIWPQMLHLLRGGRPQAEINNYDLNRFGHEEAGAPAKPAVGQPGDLAAHVEKMQGELSAAPSTAAPPRPAAPAAQPVKKLSSQPLSQEAPTAPAEDKKYAGEFYPVEKPHKHDGAFSMVELIVVMGIVTVLLSLLLPALQHARALSNVTACANNMRQIGLALRMYLNENSDITFWRGADINTDGMDWYAYGGRETGNANQSLNNYFNTPPRPLNHYLANHFPIFHCPCDTTAPWTYDTTFSSYPADNQFDWVGTSYNFNANGYPLRDPPRQDQGLDGVPFVSIHDTSDTIVFYEADLYYGKSWHYAYKGNIAFADNHVEFLPLPPQFGRIQWNP